MHARDASGRRVSLLNDESQYDTAPPRPTFRTVSHIVSQPYPAVFGRSGSTSPHTPQLFRSDSYDSQMSSESATPLTPIYDYSRMYATTQDVPPQFDEFMVDAQLYSAGGRRPSTLSTGRSSSYDEDSVPSPATSRSTSDRTGKRYPCRYRESHGCEKTFTTSGHASRHSKIHTAEKAVPCTFQGCTKKFTRADNMKQHLETHYKDKSRASARLSVAPQERRSSSSKTSSSSRKAAPVAASARIPAVTTPIDAWDLRSLNVPLLGRSDMPPTPRSGLDALAMAVACQEGA
ncbi:hypothetical protein VTK73DRAFT_374 [Phialemonium thermophilum]|uniref:C2H2 type master regulator of conidiophore development brlA n=1 Tax=Phialemonium thermophilum TaxID=223376 RepID=A0ABR3XEK0_9PEZI